MQHGLYTSLTFLIFQHLRYSCNIGYWSNFTHYLNNRISHWMILLHSQEQNVFLVPLKGWIFLDGTDLIKLNNIIVKTINWLCVEKWLIEENRQLANKTANSRTYLRRQRGWNFDIYLEFHMILNDIHLLIEPTITSLRLYTYLRLLRLGSFGVFLVYMWFEEVQPHHTTYARHAPLAPCSTTGDSLPVFLHTKQSTARHQNYILSNCANRLQSRNRGVAWDPPPPRTYSSWEQLHRSLIKHYCLCRTTRAWKNLPPELKKTKTLDTFKKHLKTFLFKQSYGWWPPFTYFFIFIFFHIPF